MDSGHIRISALDDSPVVIRGLQEIFNDTPDMEFKDGYTNPKEISTGLSRSPVDILIMEISIKDENLELFIGTVRKKFPDTKILVFTIVESIHSAKLVMRHGAAGYLLKNNSADKIVQAVRILHGGEQYIEPGIKESIFQKALLNKKPATERLKLTKREKEILRLLATNRSSNEIANMLFISRKTVENHRANMLLRFEVKNAASLIKKVIELDMLDD